MSRFSKHNFYKIINEIEQAEAANENIWIAIGILEVMYNDDCGYIDNYFHSEHSKRDKNQLWEKLYSHINDNFL